MYTLEITYMVIVAFFTYIFAEISKKFKIDTFWIPLINIGVGILSAVVSIAFKILPSDNTLDVFAAFIQCIISSLGAGGFYDVLHIKTKEHQESFLKYSEAAKLYGEPSGRIPEAPATHSKDETIDINRYEGKG